MTIEKRLMTFNLQYFADGEGEPQIGGLDGDKLAAKLGVKVSEGEKDQKAADSGPKTEGDVKEPDDGPTNGDHKDGDQNFKDDPQNKAFAEMRRKAEAAEKEKADLLARLEALEKKNEPSDNRTDEDKKYEQLAINAGRTDIKTKAEYEAALKIQQAQDRISEGKIDADSLNVLLSEAIKSNPQLSQLVSEIETIKEAAKTQEQKAIEAQLVVGLNKDIASLNEAYGLQVADIQSKSDFEQAVKSLENGEKVAEYMNKGNSLSDAYLLANKDAIIANEKKAIRQQTLNTVNGHIHVKNVKGSATDAGQVDVPPETMKIYKQLNKGKSEAEIRKHFAKYNK